MKEVCGDEVGLALDLGPGMLVPDALRLARAVEDLNVAWLEDMLTGDYVPYVSADHYREVTQSTIDADPHGRADLLAAQFSRLD